MQAGGIDLDAEDGRVEHGGRERLRAAHPAEAGGQHRPPGQVAGAEVLLGRGGEGLVGALQDPLRPDVIELPAVIWPNIVSPSASRRRNSPQVAQCGTSIAFAISTRAGTAEAVVVVTLNACDGKDTLLE